MNPLLQPKSGAAQHSRAEQASTFVLVLWIAFGLVSIALYFGSSMSLELRAADNRVSGLAAEQAIEGAVRYVTSVLSDQINVGSNGVVPDVSTYLNEAVPVGESHFWLIGRDTNTTAIGGAQMSFGLVDEASRLNVNSATSNMLAMLVQSMPRANPDIVGAILDWRSTNGTGTYQTYYASRPQPYQSKSAPFESVDELRLLYGADMDTFIGEDANRNGILDPNEQDLNHDGQLEAGLIDYLTVYSREPNTTSNGQARVNISSVTGSTGPLPDLLQNALGSSRAAQILTTLGLLSTGPVGPTTGGGGGAPGGPGGGGAGGPGTGGGGSNQPPVTVTRTFTSPLQFFRQSGMTASEFGAISESLTVTNGPWINGRVNINTASYEVLASLPGFENSPELAQTLIDYRTSNPDKLGTIAWVVDALGQNNSSALTGLQASDCLTTRSFQYTADIAALGPNGRGYRRVRVVFDTSTGSPVIVYRQDLTHLGWALGTQTRQTWLAKANR